jgi:hypothetical protein
LFSSDSAAAAAATSTLSYAAPHFDQELPVTEQITTPAFSGVGTSCHPDIVEKETQPEKAYFIKIWPTDFEQIWDKKNALRY